MTVSHTTRVTQADREAAWPFRPSCYKDNRQTREKWNDGIYDTVAPCIQAFASHREAAEAEAGAREAALREALATIAEPINIAECIGDPWDFYRDLQAVASLALTKPASEGASEGSAA